MNDTQTKTNAQHTPGPWRVDGLDIGRSVVMGPIVKVPGAVVGWEWVAEAFGVNGRKEANARLIAAAPDMLEACQEALACILKHVPATTFAPRDMLRAAIAKATGAQS